MEVRCSICGEEVIDGVPIIFDLPNGKKVCWDCKGTPAYYDIISNTKIDQEKKYNNQKEMKMKMNMSSLIRRIASLKGEMGSWSERAKRANVQIVGKKYPYSYEECSAKIAELKSSLIKSKTALAIANSSTMITWHIVDSEGSRSVTGTITEAILTMAEVKAQIALLDSVLTLDSDSETEDSWTGYGSERTKVVIERKCSMTTRKKDEEKDRLQALFASINAAVEAANHSVEISI